MDTEQFDRFAVALSRRTPRRSFLSLLTALGFTGLLARDVMAVGECLAEGEHCGPATDATCCSGWCKRKRNSRKKVCKAAPDQGTCIVTVDFCANNGGVLCDSGSRSCLCYVSSRGYAVCAQSPGECYACETDADCAQRSGVGQPGDHCIQCADCAIAGTNNRACMRACPDPATP